MLGCLFPKGFNVVAACLTKAAVETLTGKVALAIECDVTKEQDITNLVDQTEKLCSSKGLKLWTIINNAGVAGGGALYWQPMRKYRFVMEVNFFAVVAISKAFLPLLKRNENSRIKIF